MATRKSQPPAQQDVPGTWQHRVVRHVCRQWARSVDTEEGANLEIVEWYNAGPAHPNLHGRVGLTGSLADLAETVGRIQRAVERVQREPNLVRDCLCDKGRAASK